MHSINIYFNEIQLQISQLWRGEKSEVLTPQNTKDTNH